MMNFLLRSAPPVVPDQPPAQEVAAEITSVSKASGNTLEGLIADDPFTKSSKAESGDVKKDPGEALTGDPSTPMAKNNVPIKHHTDVTEDEGWITIPYRKLPEDWKEAADLLSLRALDRSFIFPGEQLHILACLSASKQETEVITPFKVAAVMSKNGISDQNGRQQNKAPETIPKSSLKVADSDTKENGRSELTQENDKHQDMLDGESILRSESHKERTQTLLARFSNSHFFVRFADTDDEPQTKRNLSESSPSHSEVGREKSRTSSVGNKRFSHRDSRFNTVIDRGSFDASAAGGMARNTVGCCALSNGDIVVLLQVNVGNNFVKDPVLEVLQFEKYQNSRNMPSYENHVNGDNQAADPCGDLLTWLLPLDRAALPTARPLSPPSFGSTVVGSASQKSTLSTSTGSQLFSFGHFRSYSMSSLPPNTSQSQSSATPSYAKTGFELEDWEKFSSQKLAKNQEVANEGLLSFRGVSLEPERFSVHCGLEGIYIPGRMWRRKVEIVQPVEIHSLASDCNTEDLLCVQIKNVSPAHIPDIVIFLDSITVVFEEAPKGGPPQCLPIACIEAGNDHSLPNLALRRGEEHSFILKPATLVSDSKVSNGRSKSSQLPYSRSSSAASSVHSIPKVGEGKRVSKSSDQYAILVSCRCNYTESRLFFKQPTSWRPRLSRDLMISVASKMSEQVLGPSGGISQLPVQVLTLQASNLTSEDLTLTVLAPASLSPPPSVVPLNSTPSTPVSPFAGFPDIAGPMSSMQRLTSLPVVPETQKENAVGGRSVSLNEHTISSPDVVPSNGLGCTHLWLQSTVPLGCVPSHSTATVKLELLPLTDGIITLDTLQIAVKEKGVTYAPEQSLKIHATSSIATGIV
ncbi:hypothetical protein H6P81_010968 [Aristolochia fimbriata]|uniref:Uncharacterized protein n=1 Tax=Aristolochia fimbriata TaxID=158543 RepID=A0AAV7EQK1_ARIFI|nr:hypothetical protein H6P81_010968 [Aristolochia fimbriata]